MDTNGTISFIAAFAGLLGTVFGTIGWTRAGKANKIAAAANELAKEANLYAKRADERAEVAEQKTAVRFELIPAEAPNRFSLRNIGTETAGNVRFDFAESPEISFEFGAHGFGAVAPLESCRFGMSVPAGIDFPPVKVTWSRPFEGHQYLQVP